ncbi:Na+/H+ antiporter [Mucilaginibacter ginsenosidivorans]|uniref:Na+/H+ antiporter n=1 Tax=Mucilaginibacter ginsenosidivorans TaxID=398053 RepID=A0A5B8UXT3_9SPHI|nr:Na+/H+ antiporter [Mucilaginibacter ginsenosidivorans]QEC63772.1 Na+/H+ antiporter [Mucilaginibacter ginsenosidivorans]
MHEILLLCLGLIFSVSLLAVVARKLRIAYPIFLALAGLLLGFLPWVPIIPIDPDLVFLIILPPILYDAAQNISLKALWKWRRIVTVMAIGFVLLTATAVAFVARWLIPGFTWAEGFLLGAIISPPDAAAASAVLRYIRMPKAIVSILEGESLLNDATSLTIFRFALIAISSSNFAFHQAVTGFLFVSVSGVAIGVVFGLIFYAIYKWMPTTANLDVALSFVLPYLIYLTAEGLHSSGVLAVVSGGLYISYQNHFVFSHTSRLKANAIWPAIVFILNAVLFFLIGLQLPVIMEGISSMSVAGALKIALIITFVIIVVRMAAGWFSGIFTTFISRYITVAQSRPGWRNPFIVGWAGMRGVVSLASALAIPLTMSNGQVFPYRNLILFITFVAIVITLVGQGLALPWIVRKVKPEYFSEAKTDEQQIVEIEIQLQREAIGFMKENYADDIKKNRLLKNRLDLLECKSDLYKDADTQDDKRGLLGKLTKHYKKIMVLVTEHQRRELHTFRRKDHYDDDIIRLIERRLDLEEERLEEDAE